LKDLEKRAKEIIATIEYATVASVDNEGMPWNAPVFTAYDNSYNFYWGTYRDSQKAKNIRSNPNVFLVIYDSTVASGTGEGVYIKATAKELSNPKEVDVAFELLVSRYGKPFWEAAASSEEGPIRYFRASPKQFWMNDESNINGHYIDIRTEISL
jgi:nitroimidazol reductase NimA-like FMN-containing flavoprotein (pyridoxamine 5'-phosphate oxidase superfamily)